MTHHHTLNKHLCKEWNMRVLSYILNSTQLYISLSLSCWAQYMVKLSKHIKPHLTILMNIDSQRVLTTSSNLHTQDKVLRKHNLIYKDMKDVPWRCQWRKNLMFFSHAWHVTLVCMMACPVGVNKHTQISNQEG